MKNSKFLIALLLLVSFCSCKFRSTIENDATTVDIKIAQDDILGKWTQLTTKKDVTNSVFENIIAINFKEDLIAEIKVSDSIGDRIIIGAWSINQIKNSKKIKKLVGLDIELNSGVLLEFLRNEKEPHIMTLTLQKKDEKLFLVSNDVLFNKEY
tara:strand:+ start:118489 stop:118950 length:462 start_codon:yes stop_codon:yes gene_type:complete